MLLTGVPGLGGSDFIFLDRPGEPLPAPLVPDVPLVDFKIEPTTPPPGGFANADALKQWLHGTLWEFPYGPETPGGPTWYVRLCFRDKYADFSWAAACGWECDSGGSAVLRHPSGHWTQKMKFAPDYQSFTFDNTWGTMKLLGREVP